jgi:hypothetical protein
MKWHETKEEAILITAGSQFYYWIAVAVPANPLQLSMFIIGLFKCSTEPRLYVYYNM